MRFISVTFDVSNFDRSSEVSPEQPENMWFISVTFDVSNFDRSSEVSPEQ